jgi:hypothetical protein
MILKLTEKQIEDSILTWLNFQPGCFAFKLDVQARYDPRIKTYRRLAKWVPRGGSDIISSVRGRMITWEVKTPAEHKKFSNCREDHEMRQKAFMDRVISTGGLAYCVCSLDQVMEIFNKLNLGTLGKEKQFLWSDSWIDIFDV